MRLKLYCRLLISRVVTFRDQPRLALIPRPEPVSMNWNRFGETLLLLWYPTPPFSLFLLPILMLERRAFRL